MLIEVSFAVAFVAAIGAFTFWSLRGHARAGGAFDWARTPTSVLELARPPETVRELCFGGLEAVLGTRAAPRRSERFKVRTHVGEEDPASYMIAFRLESLDGGTRLTVRSQPILRGGNLLPGRPEETTARRERHARFVAWLAEHGDGRVVKPRP